MARAPQARAPQASAEDDFYAQEPDDVEGTDEFGQERQEGADSPEGAPVDPGAQQAAGSEEDLDPGLELEGDAGNPLFDPERVERVAGRATNRIQSLANENRRLADRIAELERGGSRQPVPQPSGPREETDAEFEARIQLLEGSERADARMQRFIAQQQRRDFVNTVQAAATADRAAYTERARDNPRMARWQPRVEEEFQKRLNMGQAVSRLDLFYWLVGKHLDENPKAAGKERARAQDRVARNTVRPSQGSSDVRPQRRGTDERSARARRLDGVQI
jgi:hypothetical protein